MKKYTERLLIFVLCFCMCAHLMSIDLLAEDVIENATTTESEEVEIVPEDEEAIDSEEEIIASGECGDNLTWVLTSEGILTISGEGEMSDFTSATQPWEDYQDSITSAVIEEGVTRIGSYSFYLCNMMTEISIPDSVKSIGEYGFYGCSSLNNVVLPEGIVLLDMYVFYGCKMMKNLTLPSTLTRIGAYALAECNFGDLVIPEGVTAIVTYAFYISTWDSLELPNSLTSLGDYVFCSSGGVKGIVTTPPNVKMIPKGAYSLCGNMTGIIISEGTTSIGQYAFRYCNSLTEVWIPESVTTISNGAFYGLDPAEITIYGYSGSTAETYAVNNGFIFVSLDEEIFEIVTQPENQNVEIGNDAKFVVEATGTELTYQWQYSTNGEDWYNSGMTGANSKELTVPAISKRNGQMYRCIIMDAYGSQLITEEVTLTVEEITNIEIIQQPESQSVSSGENACFKVEATGDNLTYQWQYSNNGGTYWYDSGMTGSSTNELTVSATIKRDGQMYRCVIVDANGNKVTTDEVTLNVILEQIVISKQPETQTAFVGESVEFEVEAEGSNLTYQWQYSNSEGTYWYNSGMTGNSTNTLTVTALEKRNGQMYRCVITDANGSQVITDEVILYVSTELIVISVQPQDVNTQVGENAVFTVEAQGDNLTYQWQYSNNGGVYWYNSGMTGNDTNNLTVLASAKRNGQMYRCVITDANGNQIITNAAMLKLQ